MLARLARPPLLGCAWRLSFSGLNGHALLCIFRMYAGLCSHAVTHCIYTRAESCSRSKLQMRLPYRCTRDHQNAVISNACACSILELSFSEEDCVWMRNSCGSPGAPTLSGLCLHVWSVMVFMYSFPSLRSVFRPTLFQVAYLVSEAPMPQTN